MFNKLRTNFDDALTLTLEVMFSFMKNEIHLSNMR